MQPRGYPFADLPPIASGDACRLPPVTPAWLHQCSIPRSGIADYESQSSKEAELDMQPDVEGSEQKVEFYQGIGTVFPS